MKDTRYSSPKKKFSKDLTVYKSLLIFEKEIGKAVKKYLK